MPLSPGPTVDVVAAPRDGERFLDFCLVSALSQTFPIDQVFVVDDGSKGCDCGDCGRLCRARRKSPADPDRAKRFAARLQRATMTSKGC
jgi:cellulose synthase/poly-beta-1,6-N-acetylglucosamine synthase-like glycosyltransferase